MSGNTSAPSPLPGSQQHAGSSGITRKITACAACRKQKIKCDLTGSPPCTRCKKRKLSCTVNRSLQTILESDVDWKAKTDTRIRALEASLRNVTSHLSLPAADEQEVRRDSEGPSEGSSRGPRPSAMAYMSEETEKPASYNFEMVVDPASGPATIPGSVVSRVTASHEKLGREDSDIISRGVITLDQAQSYLDLYQNRLDHFLYRIIGDRKSLAEIRSSSGLLLSAICSVAALHLAAPEYERCYQDFISIASACVFSRRKTIDDVRGLSVAAFWLSGISWTCIGFAVQISTEIQLHRSIFAALDGDRTHYQRTRLYYLVYVCDHHFSVAYGRPPMTREDDAIKASMAFLESPHAVEDDARLVSQVRFWEVGSEIYAAFGIEVERPLSLPEIEPLRRLSIKLDALRADWTERFATNQYVGNYPRKGVGLHYHFAKLYLNSMALRGVCRPEFKTIDVALDIEEIANTAVLSATAILKAVVHDTEIQGYLNGLPTYFDVMIAFAAVFLMKLSTRYANAVKIDTPEVRKLVTDLVVTLERVTANMHQQHLLVSVARGTRALLSECCHTTSGSMYASDAHDTGNQPAFDHILNGFSGDWHSSSMDLFSMGDFDFLPAQNIADSFQPNGNFY